MQVKSSSLREVYKDILPSRVEGCAIILLDKDNQILLGERSDGGGLSLPGGFVEDETTRECVLRELKEEFNIEALNIEYLASFETKEEGISTLTHTFISSGYVGEIEIDDSMVSYSWYSIEDVTSLGNLFGPTRESLSRLKNPINKYISDRKRKHKKNVEVEI